MGATAGRSPRWLSVGRPRNCVATKRNGRLALTWPVSLHRWLYLAAKWFRSLDEVCGQETSRSDLGSLALVNLPIVDRSRFACWLIRRSLGAQKIRLSHTD